MAVMGDPDPAPDGMAAEIRRRVAEHEVGTMVPWTVRDARTGRAVGMTTYLNVRPDNRRLEIGSTWLAVSAQRTAVNPEAKLSSPPGVRGPRLRRGGVPDPLAQPPLPPRHRGSRCQAGRRPA